MRTHTPVKNSPLRVASSRRVLLVVNDLGVGGAQRQVVALALRYKELGASVVVASLLDGGPLESDLAAAGIPVHSLGMTRGIPAPSALLRLVRIVHREKPDVVHSHMFHANIVARVSRLLWRRTPLICTIHNVNEVSSRSTKWNEKTWRDDAYRVTNFLATETTAICDTAVRRYVGVGAFPEPRLQTVRNGIAVSSFARDAVAGARLRKQLGLEGKIVGVMVARMEPPKDFALLLRAAAAALPRVPNLHLVLIGDGPASGELKSLAASLGISAHVTFTGIRKDVGDFLSMADFFLLISIMEGLPLVLLEAAAAGLPAIASRVGGIPEAVVDGQTGFVVAPSDLEELTQAISRMAALKPAQRQALGAAAKEMVLREYDIEVVTRRWFELYGEAILARAS